MTQYQFIPIILKQELESLVLKTPRPLSFVDPNSPYLGSDIYESVYKEVIAVRCLRLARGSEYPVRSLIKIIVNSANILYSDEKDCCQKDNEVSSC